MSAIIHSLMFRIDLQMDQAPFFSSTAESKEAKIKYKDIALKNNPKISLLIFSQLVILECLLVENVWNW